MAQDRTSQPQRITPRSLDLVCSRALDSWFPLNKHLLSRLREELEHGVYDERREQLVQEIKKDFSLFTFCLRELVRLAAHTGHSTFEPSGLFYSASLEDWHTVLTLADSAPSLDAGSELLPEQADRLQRSMVSATVAEALAQSFDIHPDTAYSCALMRQLGLTLVAWNYPEAYRAALSRLSDEDNVDHTLSELLGFSPSLLGVAIARRWRLSPAVRAAIGDAAQKSGLTERERLAGEALERLCQIGEVFCQIQHGASRHAPRGQWEAALEEIEHRLGDESLALIAGKIALHCEAYASLSPELFNWGIPEEIVARPVKTTVDDYLHQNGYIKHCPRELRERLTQLYQQLKPGVVAREHIEVIVKQLIPLAGFGRGCIYLVEPDSQRLVPRLLMGGADPRQFRPYEYSSVYAEHYPVVQAFRSKIPIEGTIDVDTKTSSRFIAGLLGDQQRAGVLYLELTKGLEQTSHANPMLYYKALRLALMDCLMIRG